MLYLRKTFAPQLTAGPPVAWQKEQIKRGDFLACYRPLVSDLSAGPCFERAGDAVPACRHIKINERENDELRTVGPKCDRRFQERQIRLAEAEAQHSCIQCGSIAPLTAVKAIYAPVTSSRLLPAFSNILLDLS